MIVTILVAYDEGRVIGNRHKDGLPWDVPEELKFFKECTLGHPVIMGHNTYKSLPEKYCPLPGRENIVITRNPEQRLKDDFPNQDKVLYVSSLNRALVTASFWEPLGVDEVFIIGGEQIYQLALDSNVVDRIVVSKIKGSYYGNILFPYLESAWKGQLLERREKFDVWEYRKYPRE